MVGLVLVSHSHALAEATKTLVLSVTGTKVPVAIAAGAGDDHALLGTNAMEIVTAIEEAMSPEGVVLLLDMGSALLSAETALGFLDDEVRARVRLCAAPFVEGAVAAGALVGAGGSLAEVAREAERALHGKQEHLGGAESPAAPAAPEEAVEDAQTIRVQIPNPHGLHARPAARFIREAARFAAEIEVRNVTTQRGPVSARSLSGLASLGVLQGHEIEIAATGEAAAEALQALQQAVRAGLGDDLTAAPEAAPAKAPTQPGRPLPISGGIAIGPLFLATESEPQIPSEPAEDPEAEWERFQAALDHARAALEREQKALNAADAEIFGAQALILDDPALLDAVHCAIHQKQQRAATAWWEAYRQVAADYAALDDEYLRQRAADVRDIGVRVLAGLGIAGATVGELPKPAILVADDLTPTQVTGLSAQVEGVILRHGGRTSHAAILLRARGVPAIGWIENLNAGQTVAFNGETGECALDPTPDEQAEWQARRSAQRQAAQDEIERSQAPATTRDGRTVHVVANLGHSSEAAKALGHGAEGVGLFRTEFLFLERTTPPTEEEQYAALRSLAEAMGSRPVIVRTLDAGGDKELPYLQLPREANPFLGVRAIRLCLDRGELFLTQLRAILRAGRGANFRVMFPMITEPREIDEARLLLEEAHRQLEQAAIPHAWPLPIGIMVEVPAAAVLIDELLPQVSFVSLGTNDLTQYTLAADRGNPELSHLQDALHPAVLRLIRQVARAASRENKQVGVCGEAASDPLAAGLLLGLGVDELSLTPARIPRIKAVLRQSEAAEWQVIAETALSLQDAAEVRAYLKAVVHEPPV